MVSKWISVDERLPDDNSSVLVSHKYGVNEACFWAAGVRGRDAKWGYSFDAPYYGQDLGHSFENVTHWMPLPEPPED